jgi:yecA family protein
MTNNKTQILTKHQKELLIQLLELAENKEKALTLTELEGFLFGLAITPYVILPSEWMPMVLIFF